MGAQLYTTAEPMPKAVTARKDVRISVRSLDKAFGRGNAKVTAVDKVSFDIGRGEFVALLGPSGCGKSTILNMVAGLIPRTGGDILIDGKSMEHGQVRREIGYVFQRDTVFPWRTVEANVGYGLEIAGAPAAERRARVAEALDQVGLGAFAKAFPRTLSGGMRQRVALMRTLITRPEILLMDEPFGALDTHTKLEMHRILLQLWERERQTVLFVTHDLGEALTLADRIILLSARPGRLKEDFEVPLERPRDAVALRESPEFARLFSHIWHSLGEEFRKTKAE
ncbi:ABC transporter ATP-binding protein [Microvirga sp. VF16]|uniref:ABC transporter ATP-binding protein n=1 Tax=Microvirga sp. VF16 TaxID=2807101 RepID=UPI00193D05C1|nr:ABC transporter ATP-binding protein [Microvirga sp. VF16]QRM33429.1 ABC transporter ATP-binding protein [Microvirga sp. VF16]